MLRAFLGKPVSRGLAVLVEPLHKIGITPNQATILGLLLSVVAGVLIAQGQWVIAGALVIAAGFLDLVDGELARRKGLATRFGAFLDSTLDRLSDAAIYLGVMFNYLTSNGSLFWAFILCFAWTGAFMTSYVRARAECLIPSCEVGLMERPERVVLLLIGLFFHVMNPVIVVLAICSAFTVLQRLLFTYQQLRGQK